MAENPDSSAARTHDDIFLWQRFFRLLRVGWIQDGLYLFERAVKEAPEIDHPDVVVTELLL